jgi:hypothetical protein
MNKMVKDIGTMVVASVVATYAIRKIDDMRYEAQFKPKKDKKTKRRNNKIQIVK